MKSPISACSWALSYSSFQQASSPPFLVGLTTPPEAHYDVGLFHLITFKLRHASGHASESFLLPSGTGFRAMGSSSLIGWSPRPHGWLFWRRSYLHALLRFLRRRVHPIKPCGSRSRREAWRQPRSTEVGSCQSTHALWGSQRTAS